MSGGLGGRAPAAAARAAPADRPRATSGDIPQEVEAAVYFCCLEALQNAGKHSPGSAVTIELRRDQANVPDGGEVHFSICDEGPGFDPAATPAGHGLQNMADRAGALGGSVEWHSSPGRGTTIEGWVPVGSRP